MIVSTLIQPRSYRTSSVDHDFAHAILGKYGFTSTPYLGRLGLEFRYPEVPADQEADTTVNLYQFLVQLRMQLESLQHHESPFLITKQQTLQKLERLLLQQWQHHPQAPARLGAGGAQTEKQALTSTRMLEVFRNWEQRQTGETRRQDARVERVNRSLLESKERARQNVVDSIQELVERSDNLRVARQQMAATLANELLDKYVTRAGGTHPADKRQRERVGERALANEPGVAAREAAVRVAHDARPWGTLQSFLAFRFENATAKLARSARQSFRGSSGDFGGQPIGPAAFAWHMSAVASAFPAAVPPESGWTEQAERVQLVDRQYAERTRQIGEPSVARELPVQHSSADEQTMQRTVQRALREVLQEDGTREVLREQLLATGQVPASAQAVQMRRRGVEQLAAPLAGSLPFTKQTALWSLIPVLLRGEQQMLQNAMLLPLYVAGIPNTPLKTPFVQALPHQAAGGGLANLLQLINRTTQTSFSTSVFERAVAREMNTNPLLLLRVLPTASDKPHRPEFPAAQFLVQGDFRLTERAFQELLVEKRLIDRNIVHQLAEAGQERTGSSRAHWNRSIAERTMLAGKTIWERVGGLVRFLQAGGTPRAEQLLAPLAADSAALTSSVRLVDRNLVRHAAGPDDAGLPRSGLATNLIRSVGALLSTWPVQQMTVRAWQELPLDQQTPRGRNSDNLLTDRILPRRRLRVNRDTVAQQSERAQRTTIANRQSRHMPAGSAHEQVLAEGAAQANLVPPAGDALLLDSIKQVQRILRANRILQTQETWLADQIMQAHEAIFSTPITQLHRTWRTDLITQTDEVNRIGHANDPMQMDQMTQFNHTWRVSSRTQTNDLIQSDSLSRVNRTGSANPSTPASESMQSTPRSRVNRAGRAHPITSVHVPLQSDPVSRVNRAGRANPLTPANDSMQPDPVSRVNRAGRANPLTPANDSMQPDPVSRINRAGRVNPLTSANESMQSDPVSRVNRTGRANPLTSANESMQPDSLSRVNQTGRANPLTPANESMQSDPVSRVNQTGRANPFTPTDAPVQTDSPTPVNRTWRTPQVTHANDPTAQRDRASRANQTAPTNGAMQTGPAAQRDHIGITQRMQIGRVAQNTPSEEAMLSDSIAQVKRTWRLNRITQANESHLLEQMEQINRTLRANVILQTNETIRTAQFNRVLQSQSLTTIRDMSPVNRTAQANGVDPVERNGQRDLHNRMQPTSAGQLQGGTRPQTAQHATPPAGNEPARQQTVQAVRQVQARPVPQAEQQDRSPQVGAADSRATAQRTAATTHRRGEQTPAQVRMAPAAAHTSRGTGEVASSPPAASANDRSGQPHLVQRSASGAASSVPGMSAVAMNHPFANSDFRAAAPHRSPLTPRIWQPERGRQTAATEAPDMAPAATEHARPRVSIEARSRSFQDTSAEMDFLKPQQKTEDAKSQSAQSSTTSAPVQTKTSTQVVQAAPPSNTALSQVDLDRIVSKVYRELERNLKAELQRRGL